MATLTIEERKRLSTEKIQYLKNLFKNNKKIFFGVFLLGGVVGGYVNLAAYDYFMVDKIKQNEVQDQRVMECFYDHSCNQQISGLSLTFDRQKINEIAYAYELKKYVLQYPDRYKNASPEAKEKIDNILKLTN